MHTDGPAGSEADATAATDRGGWSLAAATAAALIVRLTRFPRAFSSSDAVDLPTLVEATACDGQGPATTALLLLQYRLGGVQPLLTWPLVEAADAAGVPLTPLVWALPALLAGSALPLVAATLLRQLGARRAGLWAAWGLALSPAAVVFSRHTGAPWMIEACLDLGVLAATVAVARRPSRSMAWVWAVLIGMAAWVGNQALAVLPLTVLTVLVCGWADLQARREPLQWARRFAGPWLAVPVLSWGLALTLAVGMGTGHLHHALFTKPKVLGWYGPAVLEAARQDLGWPVLVLLVALVAVALARARHRPRATLVVGALLAAQGLPFVVLIPPESTELRTYLVQALDAAVLLAALGLAALPRTPRWALGVATGLAMLAAVSAMVWRLPLSGLGAAPTQGSFHPPWGLRTLMVAVRDDLPADAVLFTDAWGGGGLEPNLVELTTRRDALGLYDAPRPSDPYAAAAGTRPDLLLVAPENMELARATFPTMVVTHRVVRDGTPILLGLQHAGPKPPVDLPVDPAPYWDGPEARLCGTPATRP